MLLEMGQPAEALAAYEASLREAPNRFNSLYGAAHARRELVEEPDRARELYAKLVAQCVADSPRPELAAARRYLAGRLAAGPARSGLSPVLASAGTARILAAEPGWRRLERTTMPLKDS